MTCSSLWMDINVEQTILWWTSVNYTHLFHETIRTWLADNSNSLTSREFQVKTIAMPCPRKRSTNATTRDTTKVESETKRNDMFSLVSFVCSAHSFWRERTVRARTKWRNLIFCIHWFLVCVFILSGRKQQTNKLIIDMQTYDHTTKKETGQYTHRWYHSSSARNLKARQRTYTDAGIKHS
jgi:hypothetical protein